MTIRDLFGTTSTTSPAELRVLTADMLIRAMIAEGTSTVSVYIDGIEYHLSLDYVG